MSFDETRGWVGLRERARAAQLRESLSRKVLERICSDLDTKSDWLYNLTMTARRMGAAQFKERCLQVLDELPAEGVVITKRGKPVARLMPFERSGENLIGALKGKIKVRGDIMGTGVDWDASAADD